MVSLGYKSINPVSASTWLAPFLPHWRDTVFHERDCDAGTHKIIRIKVISLFS